MERRKFLTGTGASFLAGAAGAGSLLSVFTRSAAAREVAGNPANVPSARKKGSITIQSEDLTRYTGTWGDAQLRHLLRRAMFGVPESQFTAAQALGSMDAVVEQLLACSDTTKVPLPVLSITPPAVAPWLETIPVSEPNLLAWENQEIVNWWFDQMMQESLSIRQKMTLMWTNHFVTGSQTVNISAYMYQYLVTCMTNALGNFKNLALAISTDPAMLVYLNGDQSYVTSKVNNQNENYARELMELFTMGINFPGTDNIPNYTQDDIENSARALTGWTPTTTPPFQGTFNSNRHDATSKTFLGQTGNWALSDIINIIFQQPTATYPPNAPTGFPEGYTSAWWACYRIYRTFVYYNPSVTDPKGTVLDAMARLMVQNNFEIAPVMQALLTSAHFYDPSVIGAQIKSPCEFVGSLVREFGLTYPAFNPEEPPDANKKDGNGNEQYTDSNPTISALTNLIMNTGLGQQLLNPPNVAGWPGGENWLSAGSFQNRQSYSTAILGSTFFINAKQEWDLVFTPQTYAGQIANAGTLSEGTLFGDLEQVSLEFILGPVETANLAPNPSKTDDVIDTAIPTFAPALATLPEFQLL